MARMIVLTNGVFDLLHYGHLKLLVAASEMGELTVALKEDKAVFEQKGHFPVLSLKERTQQVSVLPFVASVTSYSSNEEVLLRVRPDIFTHADDWHQQADRTEFLRLAEDIGAQIVLLPYTEGISATEILRRLGKRLVNDGSFKRQNG